MTEALEVDPDLGRAKDLSWALAQSSWGDLSNRLGADLSKRKELALPLNRSWSVIYAACLFRGWLPPSERACEAIGELLSWTDTNEGRRLSELVARIEASSDPRLALQEGISGSVWRRVDPYGALSWAQSDEVDELVILTPAVRSLARTAAAMKTTAGRTRPKAQQKEPAPVFRAKSVNPLFTVFLALAYTSWGYRTLDDAEDVVEHLRQELKKGPSHEHLDEFQLSVVTLALELSDERLQGIFKNAEELFSHKATVSKRTKKIRNERAANRSKLP